MKHSIGRRILLTNIVIVVAALLAFFGAVSLILNSYTVTNLSNQLLLENFTAFRLAVAQTNAADDGVVVKRGALVETLSQSHNLVYTFSGTDYLLSSGESEDFPAPENIAALIDEYIKADETVLRTKIQDTEYLYTVTYRGMETVRRNSTVVVSFISLDGLSGLLNQYLITLLGILAGILLLAAVVCSLISRRITGPIKRLVRLTSDYAKNDFSQTYIANTGDEVEGLSRAISVMGDSLHKQNVYKEKLYRQISHELKTPLTAIYGYAEGMKSNIYKSNDEALDVIMRESMRIKKLTEDIVLLSKLETKIEVFNFQRQSLGATIERAIKGIESLAILNDIDIVYHPVQTSAVMMDEDKIYRALLNLLSNCMKYTKDLVEIELFETGDSVVIRISDNGNGFDEDAIQNLNRGLARETSSGSGIGLSIVREIIQAHKGRLTVSNKTRGTGAVFEVKLFV